MQSVQRAKGPTFDRLDDALACAGVQEADYRAAALCADAPATVNVGSHEYLDRDEFRDWLQRLQSRARLRRLLSVCTPIEAAQ